MTDDIGIARRIAQTGSLVLFALLVFLWSVPGLVAVRNALPVLLLISLLALKPDYRNAVQTLRQPLVALPLVALSLWIAFHNSFLAWEPAHAWRESSQWFKSLAVFAIGVLVANSPGWKSARSRHIAWLGALGVSYTAYLAFQIAYKPWSLDAPVTAILQQNTLVGSRDLGSYLGTALVALWLAELASQAARGISLFGARRWLAPLALLVSMGLTVAMMTRNALPVMFVVTCGAFIAYAQTRTRSEFGRTAAIGVLGLVVVLGAAAVSVHGDPRWKTLSAAVQAGVDIEHNKAWLDQESAERMPLAADGKPVDSSAYMRAAWMTGLLDEIRRNPLGVGFDRNAFGRALKEHYGRPVSTQFGHSGILDFTLGLGIPGGLLFVATLGALVASGVRRWREARSGAGLALALFVAAYGLRACIDGTVRDHMIEQAFFVAGLLFGLAKLGSQAPAAPEPAR
ncbi:hypothetical protein OPU71_01055 [Niveibacterium sp. 24ML]|uniref:O-antigen ligase family protein n=1 Tax=Niveibacterium sp. 24ML TaxID=2985512 RepID=UPI0022705F2B|nr:O-antigen ligase family protein [Niveibacterium sp. 24ML]MCX9154707.1 hypothetical protein [Niveibacterium sp. 24ML]